MSESLSLSLSHVRNIIEIWWDEIKQKKETEKEVTQLFVEKFNSRRVDKNTRDYLAIADSSN